MRHVGHSVCCVTIELSKFVLIGTDNHQVRTNVELMAGGRNFTRFPSPEIHVRNTHALNVRRAAGKAVLHPAQEYCVKTAGLIVRIPRNTWKTGPLSRPFPKEPVFTSRH